MPLSLSLSSPVRLLIGILVLIALPGGAAAQQPPPRAQYDQLAEGVLGSSAPLFASDSLPRYRIEVRDLVIGPNKTAPRVPLEGFALLELRSGIVETTTEGKPVRREVGSIWLVQRGAPLAVRNLGEVAIIRATVLIPR